MSPFDLESIHPAAQHWSLDPGVAYLNHGSFGACPTPVLETQQELQARLERQPVQFLARDLEPMLDEARDAGAKLVGVDADDFAFVSNATAGVNTVLRSLEFGPGDELLTTNHGYNACINALRFVADRAGAKAVVAEVPFEVQSSAEVVDAVRAAMTPRTKLVLLDHITSPTGSVWPIQDLVAMCNEAGVDTLVDGAHAPGMVDLDVPVLGCAYYTGNFHKWVCTPKGAAFLWVRRDRQEGLRPLSISHGANAALRRSRFRLEFDWAGTADPTPFLTVPAAIRFLNEAFEGGLPALRQRNRELALAARDLLCGALGIAAPVPDSMIGSLVSLPLPDGGLEPPAPQWTEAIQKKLYIDHRIEAPIFSWPERPHRLLRVSAQLYNHLEQYHGLAAALPALLADA